MRLHFLCVNEKGKAAFSNGSAHKCNLPPDLRNMRLKIFCFILVCICCLLAPRISPADDDAANRRVKAGIFNFDGYHMKDEKGGLDGYGIDLLGLISEYSHLNFLYSGYEKSWQEMLDMLKNGDIDLVTSARRTPEREQHFAYSLPVGRNFTLLTVKTGNPRLLPGDYHTYDGMVVGQIAGSSQNRALEEFARSKGFTYRVKTYKDSKKLGQALQDGDVDAILSSNLRQSKNETTLDVIHVDNFYLITRKEDQDLLNEINYAIEQINKNEGDWQNDLYYRYYGIKPADRLDFSEREKEYIRGARSRQKKITATSRGDRAPYSYIEDGKLKGILPDYFAKIMGSAGLPFEFVPPRDDYDYHVMAENNGATVVLDRTRPHGRNEVEAYRGFTTDPYMNTGMARVTRTDFDGPVGKVAIVGSNSPKVGMETLGDADIVHFSTPREAMDAVKNGAVDAAYVYPYMAQLYVNHDPDNSLYYTMLNDRGASFRMYVPETVDHELISILNKGIRHLPEGTLNQISSRYTSFTVGSLGLAEYLRAHPGLTLAGALVLALGCSLLLVMFVHGRWHRRMLAAADSANRELEGQLSIVEALSRDYTNVLALNEDRATVRIVKLKGYVPQGLMDGPDEQPYPPILDTYVRDRVHPGDRAYLREALDLGTIGARLAAGGDYTGSYRIIMDGETHYFQFTCVKMRDNAGFDGAFILMGFRNVDDMMKKEQEQKAALKDALDQARYASAAKTAFLNNMSHDIRTPMNAIIGFTALASKHVGNTAQVEGYLAKITTSGKHLLSLINDVLDMSRIESGKVKIEEQETSLPEIVRDLSTIVQADVKSKQLSFQIDTLNVVNETIFCDRLRLNQVLLNILSNAMKYTRPGGSVGVRIIQKATDALGMAAFDFIVSDTGIGMSQEFLAHLFEPFEREQTSTVSGIQGTGLGMAITKNIVDMMGGTISVTSEPGKGSVFTVSLHFRVTEKDEGETCLPRYAGMRALVVDDDINTCTSVSRMLSALGMRPDWTTLAREGIVRSQFAVEQNEAYGIFFIDWVMPDMNGIELVRRLRKTIRKEIPIIILTAYDWGDMEEEAREAGVTGFCSKPVFLSELRSILADPVNALQGDREEPVDISHFADKSILLAEDNEMNQEIAQMILEGAGFRLDIVENGALAVERMEQMPPDAYDLILMDVQMPVMDGYEATRRIRALADPLKSRIPIVAMTANAFAEDRREAMASGMNSYVAKPIDMKELMRELDIILKNGVSNVFS